MLPAVFLIIWPPISARTEIDVKYSKKQFPSEIGNFRNIDDDDDDNNNNYYYYYFSMNYHS
jgi:hypothetical protein